MREGMFVMRWPIEDRNAPLASLRAEAAADLSEALRLIGYRATAVPALEVQHGQRPTLTARVPVCAVRASGPRVRAVA